MNEYDLLREIDSDIERTNDYLYDIKDLLTQIRDMLRLMAPSSVPSTVSTEGAAWAAEQVTP